MFNKLLNIPSKWRGLRRPLGFGPINESTPLIKQLAHILGQFACEVHLLTCPWVDESKSSGVQSLPRAYLEAVLYECLVSTATLSTEDLGSAIAFVAEERMPDMFHVGTYLMSATGLQNTFNKRYVTEPLKYPVVGHGTFAYSGIRRKDCHPKPVMRVAGYISFYAALILSEVAPNQGVIATVCRLIEELQSQSGLRFRSLCNHKQSAGILVNTVDKTDFRVIWVERLHVAQVPSYGVDERSVEISRAGMDNQSCGFVYDHYVAVLIYYIKRYIFCRYCIIMTWAVEHQSYDIVRANLIAALHRTVVDMNESCVGSLLNAVATGVLHAHEQVLVDSLRLLTFVDYKPEMLIELLLAIEFLIVHVIIYIVQFFLSHLFSRSS